jgi:hypothetical protein
MNHHFVSYFSLNGSCSPRILQTDGNGRTPWAGDELDLEAVACKGQLTEETPTDVPGSMAL